MENELEGTTGAPAAQAANATEQTDTGKVEFTPEQQAMLEKILAREAEKVQRRTEKRLQELQEAEKLKNMSDADRTVAELEQARQKLAEYEREKLAVQYAVELAEKGLPKELAAVIPVTDAEQAKAAVDALANLKKQTEAPLLAKIDELEKQLKNTNLRGTPPKAPFAAAKTENASPVFQDIFKKLKS